MCALRTVNKGSAPRVVREAPPGIKGSYYALEEKKEKEAALTDARKTLFEPEVLPPETGAGTEDRG